ncbi:hypothetical protein LG302_01025 [Halomonas organivorans]
MKKLLLASATASVLLVGCAGPSIQPPSAYSTDHGEIYSADFDRVWENTVDWFAVNNIPIKNIEKDSGIIGSEYALGSDYSQVDCGQVDPGDMHILTDQTVVANINVLVRQSGSGATVQPNVFGQGSFQLHDVWNNRPTSIKADRCVSTGELEQDLHNYLRANL